MYVHTQRKQLTMEEEKYLSELASFKPFSVSSSSSVEEKIAKHKTWLNNLSREYPNENHPYKVAIYIRYFNQTKHANYLQYHKRDFIERLAQCPMWEVVDFYVDEGQTAPAMESAPEWCRLLEDCQNGKVDLIITQKVANVSSDMTELTFLARYFAGLPHPIGMYFISEDIFTLASYYKEDGKDRKNFLPSEDWQLLPDDNEPQGGLLE